MLRSQDIVVLLKLVCLGESGWTLASLGEALGISASEVHGALRRAEDAGLYLSQGRRPVRSALLEFAVHGVRYAFATKRSAAARGVVTGHGVPGLNSELAATAARTPLVWPDPAGDARGEAVAPLYRSVPFAVRGDPCLHRLLGLVDAIRVGSARERAVAAAMLKRALTP